MLPLVQHFPEDRLIFIETDGGVCNIVAWIHIILGLSITLNLNRGAEQKSYQFGTPTEQQVVVVFGQGVVPSIALMSAADQEVLFKMVKQPDEEELTAAAKSPTDGYLARTFSKVIGYEPRRDTVILEMIYVTAAFAVCISRCLHHARPTKDPEQYEDGGPYQLLRYIIPETRIVQATKLLSGVEKLNSRKLDDYIALYTNKAPYHQEPVPPSMGALTQGWKDEENAWPELCLAASQLCVLVLAFAHVTDLDSCSDFEMSENHGTLASSELSMAVAEWDGTSPIEFDNDDEWFQILALMLIGHTGEVEFPDISLLSHWGWSIYLSTHGDSDPSFVGKLIGTFH